MPKLIGNEISSTHGDAPTDAPTTTTNPTGFSLSVLGGLSSEPSSNEKGGKGGNGVPSPTSPAEWLGDPNGVLARTQVRSAPCTNDGQPDGLTEPSSSTTTVTSLTVPPTMLKAKLEPVADDDEYVDDESGEEDVVNPGNWKVWTETRIGRPRHRDDDHDDDNGTPTRSVVPKSNEYVQPGVSARIDSIESIRNRSQSARAVLAPNQAHRASTPRGDKPSMLLTRRTP